ncbi:class I SAM-dependent methyltransferase [Candidatus Woesearchaeota archaeon]|jgi:SAM-dependent methyltransferase|nr:class I SAM-dependent methyltransferase [Candidatus Woesearchaeota archaeon]MBT4110577.1 class I SAM-dependent methyltransferase [Candidatus Woesearchaeota archaeon]MBT4335899.1 class I SAM-dependent methyltransferase [Candidatus Woesearchaeota archaeon]MBT4469122.1 class I SAM-dependent methyltransferase [Candidatus Woesearchaeota archaeon]MBT6744559.1 class I SAM-dependent methyltransferase [Candidatus Woesearchaeota archaeon]
MITRNQQKEKYETDLRYHSDSDNLNQTFDNRYSLRNNWGLYFELIKFKEMVKLLNKSKVRLKNKKILDLGCHRGFTSNLLAQLKGSSENIYGADFINSFVEQAQEINPGVKFFQHDVYNELPFENSYFDLVTLIYLFNALPSQDQQEVVKNISKKIKVGGHILFFDLFESRMSRVTQRLAHLNKRYTPLPHFNDKIIKKLFPDFKIIQSKKIINLLTYRTIGFSYGLAEFLDKMLPCEYYITLLRKIK